GLRARVGLRPKTPQQEAGIRIDPPPSLAWAMGTMPAATAAADPPLEPPAVCVRRQGFRVGPKRRGSVEGASPISRLLVLPNITRPPRLRRAVISLSWSTPLSFESRLPFRVTAPSQWAPLCLRGEGTRAHGP